MDLAIHQGAVGRVVEFQGGDYSFGLSVAADWTLRAANAAGPRRKRNGRQFFHLISSRSAITKSPSSPCCMHSWPSPGTPTLRTRAPRLVHSGRGTLVTNPGFAADRLVIRHDRPSGLEAMWNRCRSEMLRDRLLVVYAPRPAKRNLAGDPCPPPARLGFG